MLQPQKFTAVPNMVRILNRTHNMICVMSWERKAPGPLVQVCKNIEPNQFIQLPQQDGTKWTFCDQYYSPFCWMGSTVNEQTFSFQTREPFCISTLADHQVFPGSTYYTYMMVDDDSVITTNVIDSGGWTGISPSVAAISDETWAEWESIVSSFRTNTGIDVSKSDRKYPGLDKNSPAIRRCQDALILAIADQNNHRGST